MWLQNRHLLYSLVDYLFPFSPSGMHEFPLNERAYETLCSENNSQNWHLSAIASPLGVTFILPFPFSLSLSLPPPLSVTVWLDLRWNFSRNGLCCASGPPSTHCKSESVCPAGWGSWKCWDIIPSSSAQSHWRETHWGYYGGGNMQDMESICQSINQSNNQPTYQPMNQPTNQLINQSTFYLHHFLSLSLSFKVYARQR